MESGMCTCDTEYEKILELGNFLLISLDGIPTPIKGSDKLKSKIRQEIFCLEKVCLAKVELLYCFRLCDYTALCFRQSKQIVLKRSTSPHLIYIIMKHLLTVF